MTRAIFIAASILLCAASASAQCRWNNIDGWVCRGEHLPSYGPPLRPHGAPNPPYRPRGQPCPPYQPRGCWYGDPPPNRPYYPPLSEEETRILWRASMLQRRCLPELGHLEELAVLQ